MTHWRRPHEPASSSVFWLCVATVWVASMIALVWSV